MTTKKRHLVLVMVAAGALILSACSSQSEKSGDDGSRPLSVAGSFPITSLNPYGQYSRDAGTGFAAAQFSDTLVFPDGKGGYTPHLAKSFKASEDGTTWTMKLRKAEFSDGTEFTSADVKASFDLVASSGGPLSGPFKEITLGVPDAHTVTFSSDSMGFGILTYVAQLPISPAKKMSKSGFWDKPVGIGPYKVKSFTSNQELDLVPNPHYWGPQPKSKVVKLKTIKDISARITALKNDEVQAIWGVPDDLFKPLTQDSTLITKTEPSTGGFVMWMNAKQKGLSDLKVRTAIWKAINFKAIQKSLYPFSATIAKAPVSQGIAGAGKFAPYTYDPDEAKKLLAEAGFANGLTVGLQYDSSHPDFAGLVAAMKSDLAKVGVTLDVHSKEHAVWLKDLLGLDFGINVQTTGPGKGDPMAYFARLYTCKANRTGFCSPELDKLIAAGSAANDPKVRTADFKKVQKFVWEHAIGMFPMDIAITYAWRKNVHGFVPDPNYEPKLTTVTVGDAK